MFHHVYVLVVDCGAVIISWDTSDGDICHPCAHPVCTVLFFCFHDSISPVELILDVDDYVYDIYDAYMYSWQIARAPSGAACFFNLPYVSTLVIVLTLPGAACTRTACGTSLRYRRSGHRTLCCPGSPSKTPRPPVGSASRRGRVDAHRVPA